MEIKITSAPAIDKKGDLAAMLTSLKPFSVLFIEVGFLPQTLEFVKRFFFFFLYFIEN